MEKKELVGAAILRALRGREGFVSGERLSKTLSISRAALHKKIDSLREAGYEVESVTRKGYRFLSYPDAVDAPLLLSGAQTKYIGREILSFEELDSTNTYAKKIAAESPEGTIVIANEQTKGRGRRGRSFYSAKGEGIFFSVILKPDISPEKAPFITGLAAAALSMALDDLGVKTRIKWPNDILLNGKKIAGILTEMSGDVEKVEYIILGIGLNVSNRFFPEELRETASSLKMEGCGGSRQEIFWKLICSLENLYEEYLKGEKSGILKTLRERSAVLGREIMILTAEGQKSAVALDLSEDGGLIVDIRNEGRQKLSFGEISIREKKE